MLLKSSGIFEINFYVSDTCNIKKILSEPLTTALLQHIPYYLGLACQRRLSVKMVKQDIFIIFRWTIIV